MNYNYFKGMGDVEREQDDEGRGDVKKGRGGRMLEGRGVKGDVEVRGVLKGRGGC